ncbi:MAG: hypothetical protein A7316_10005 [Candidatus Altiarchaeales archaeon WOR_SM1_86-2]|nr:MAG: hypothetical protein A7316_10005 [Candidatus Altiarchaeales archaeon WOR_SM1_86-2]
MSAGIGKGNRTAYKIIYFIKKRMITHSEEMESDFRGVIIDIETVGDFDNHYGDSRRCRNIRPVVFGFIDSGSLQIYCAEHPDEIERLIRIISETLPELERPLYAFNANFEMSVLFHTLGKEIRFERELNIERYEGKGVCRLGLGIPNYDDPFKDNGYECMKAWWAGEFDNVIAHNRSCLLKERDILLKRGYREPDKLRFVKG